MAVNQRVQTRRLGQVNNSPGYAPIGDNYVQPAQPQSSLGDLANSLGVAMKGADALYQQSQEDKVQEQKDNIAYAGEVEKRYRANQALKLKNNVSEVERDLKKKYLDDPELQNSAPEELEAWVDEQTGGLLDKVNDPQMREAYGGSLLGVRNGLLDTHNENLRVKQKEDSMQELGVSVTNALDESPGNFSEVAENLRNYGITNLGLSKQEVDGVLVDAATNKARDPNNPSLAGIQYLRNKKHPAGGSIADIPEFRRRLDSAEASYDVQMRRRQAEAEAKAKAEADAQSWRVRAAMGDRAEEALLTPEEIDEGVAGGFLTESQAVSLYNKNQERTRELETIHSLADAVLDGDTAAYHTSDAPQKLKDEMWTVTAQRALEANDGDAVAAQNQVLDSASELGVLPKPYKVQLNNATPSNPEGFQEAFQLYQNVNNSDPNLIANNVSSDQADMFAYYNRLRARGEDENTAINTVREHYQSLGKGGRALSPREKDKLRRGVSDVVPGDPFFGEVKNTDYATQQIMQGAEDRLAESPETLNMEDAIEVSKEDFKRSHMLVKDRAIKLTHPVPKLIKDNMDQVSQVYRHQQLKGTPYEDSEIVLFPTPNQPDLMRPMQVRGESLVPVPGATPVSQKALYQELVKDKQESARQEQQEMMQKETESAVERMRELEGLRNEDGSFASRDMFTIGSEGLEDEYNRLKERLEKSNVDWTDYKIDRSERNRGAHPLQQKPWENE